MGKEKIGGITVNKGGVRSLLGLGLGLCLSRVVTALSTWLMAKLAIWLNVDLKRYFDFGC